MSNIGNIIAQLTAAQTSLSPAAPAQGQGSASATNSPGGNSSTQSFQTALNNASQSTGPNQSTGSTGSGQVLPPAQNDATQNISSSNVASQSTPLTITANPGFAGLANLLGDIIQQQKPQAQSQTANSSTPQSTADNLLINGNTGQGNQTNITSPEALLQFIIGRNSTLLASNNNNVPNSNDVLASSANANINNANSTTQPVDSSQQQSKSPNVNDPALLASILAQINPVLNFAANSQGLANASGNAANLSINPNASSSNELARILAAQTATITSQQNQPTSDTTINTNNNQAIVSNPQVLDANQKTALQNFAIAFASNTIQGQSTKPTTKLVSESKIPDFSNFSNQVFAVKPDTKTAVPANSAVGNVANDVNNNNSINNAVAAIGKSDEQLKSDAAKGDNAAAVDTANASGQLQLKTGAGEVKTTTVAPDNLAKYQTPAEQVVFQVAAAVKDGNSKIRIQLEPAELGKIDVQISMNGDGKINLNITADKSSTLTMLQSDSKSLEKSLNDIGFKSDATNLSFNLRQGGNNGQPQNWTYQNYGTASVSGQDAAEVTAYSALPSLLTSNQALDIRV